MQMSTSAHIRTLAVLSAATALTFAGTSVATAKPGGVRAIPLNNEQETTGADTGASGFFSYTVAGDQFCYTLEARDLSVPAAAAHVHLGPRNIAGPVVIPLVVGSGTSWTVQTCTTASPDLLDDIAADAGAYYVNVHTSTFAGGEIRGQLK
jgi:hypothetical protein